MARSFLLAVLIVAVGASGALAQTGTTPSTSGAFTSLSPGNQKIARALFEAQVSQPASGTTPTSGTSTGTTPTGSSTTTSATTTTGLSPTGSTVTAPKPLTLDQIAAMKQSGQGWGQVFKQLQAHGLVQEKNLGRVVSRSHRPDTQTSATAPSTTSAQDGYRSTGPVITSGSGRTYAAGPKHDVGGREGRGPGVASADSHDRSGHGVSGRHGSSLGHSGSGYGHGGGRDVSGGGHGARAGSNHGKH